MDSAVALLNARWNVTRSSAEIRSPSSDSVETSRLIELLLWDPPRENDHAAAMNLGPEAKGLVPNRCGRNPNFRENVLGRQLVLVGFSRVTVSIRQRFADA